MGELTEWSKKNSKQVILMDGERIEAKYDGYKIITSPFDAERELVSYRFRMMQDGVEVIKVFNSASFRATKFFDGLPKGSAFRMSRSGEGNKTEYKFVSLTPGSQVAPAFAEDETASGYAPQGDDPNTAFEALPNMPSF